MADGAETPAATDACLHDLFEARARLHPEALAAREGSRSLSYAQLDRDANRVARGLLRRGVTHEECVAVLAERSLEYLVAILGVLKAGAAYLPLDPHQPDERIRYVARDAGARVVLAQRRLADRAGGPIVPIEVGAAAGPRFESAPAVRVRPDALAYVIYTSGSTGQPKGVMVEHRSVVNLVHFYREHFSIDADDRFTQIQRPGFDACVAEIWPALAWGASLHVADAKTVTQPVRLMQWLDREDITICDVPTVLAEALFDVPAPPTLRLRALVTGGDKLRRRPPPGFCCPVYDQYGPTENTVVTTLARVAPEDVDPGPLHIGRPVSGHRVYILDAERRPVARGSPGEIYVAGVGLARGYLGDPALTAERFLPDPFSPGARLYRTGDLGRELPSGDLEYLGRADDQVKIRGFRVEIGEIERRLSEHPAVADALVQALEPDGGREKRLVGHYRLLAGKSATRRELRSFLAERLPNYMLPTLLAEVAAWPTTVNGKIDHRAVAAGVDWSDRGGQALVPPRNAVDARLVEIWQDALGVRPIGITDDFFELGGQSLMAANVAAQVESELAVDLPIALFFQAPTIAEISDHVRGEAPIATEPGLVPLATRGAQPPLFVLPGVGGHVLAFRSLALALPDQPCFGLQDPALGERREPLRSVEEMARHFLELVRTVDPHGPYRLLGYSLGGLVAYEMAQQLVRQGSPPAFVGLLDTPAPGYPAKLPLAARIGAHLSNLRRLTSESRRDYLKERWRNLLLRLRAAEDRQAYEHEIADRMPPRLLEVLSAHRLAGERYEVGTYAGGITLFRAQEHPDWPATSFDDPRMGWGSFVRGPVAVFEVPGAHLEVLDTPHTPMLAAHVATALASVA